MATAPIQTTYATIFGEDMHAIGRTPHAEQMQMAGMLEHALTAKPRSPVAFIEAPTGTGKTYVTAHHALRLAADNAETVVIAVPTLEIAHQTRRAIEELAGTRPNYGHMTVRVVLGRQEFVDADQLATLAEGLRAAGRDAAADAMLRWHRDNGPGETPAYPSFTRRGLEHALQVAGEPVELPDSIQLGHSPEDPAHEAHIAQFGDADIFIATHAMLGRDLARRYIAAARARRAAGMELVSSKKDEQWIEAHQQRLEVETEAEGRLPQYHRLLVDEAHLLRDNIENALASSISMRHLHTQVAALRHDHPRKVPDGVVARIREMFDEMTTHSLRGEGSVTIDWTDHKGLGDVLEDLHDTLKRIKLNDAMIATTAGSTVRNAIYALREAITGRDHTETTLSWSPVHTLPSIRVGRRRLSGELAFMWERLRSAALISATLYTQNKAGPSLEYMAQKLGVREPFRVAYAPIAAPWMTAPVSVMIPGPEMADRFTPPREGEDRGAWLDRLAAQIVEASRNSTGTLVLSTSRHITSELAKRLNPLVGKPDRVIDGTTRTLSGNKEIFVAKARRGEKPVWIAQGPAWTGLDLPDDTLDSLVITKLPFPQPRPGGTAGGAPRYDGGHVAQMMMTLKQGMGRLVRSRDAGPKKAWILDGRIHGDGPGRAAMSLVRQYE